MAALSEDSLVATNFAAAVGSYVRRGRHYECVRVDRDSIREAWPRGVYLGRVLLRDSRRGTFVSTRFDVDLSGELRRVVKVAGWRRD